MSPRARLRESSVIATVLVTLVSVLDGFNVDTRHAIIFRGPAAEADTYFGYTVALTGGGPAASSSGGPWVLVGAPRANSTLGVTDADVIREPGALFRCPPLSDAPCEEVLVDAAGNNPAGDFSYTNLRDGGWLGGTLDAETSAGGRLVVCAPRWRNQRYGGHYLGNGACYTADNSAADDTFRKLVPLSSKKKQYTHLVGINAYLYSYGQAGVSAHIGNGGDLLLGAPGVFDWTGTVAQYPSISAEAVPFVPDPSAFAAGRGSAMDRYDYFGYAVSSGTFSAEDSRPTYLVGAPRAAGGKGKVYLVHLPDEESEAYSVISERVGAEVGEYFGAAVLAVDVNGDGLGDVVVGAPLSKSAGGSYDAGRVVVYMNGGSGQLRQSAVLEGRAAGGRLGSALASLGDLDRDGFDDIAVGAPYEEDGRGAVYLYRGGPGEFAATPAQRIAADDVSDTLRGFGISISRGVDIDGNEHPDFAVGAYSSGDSVLLRSRPVIQFVSSLSSSPERLDMAVKQFQTKACLSYSGARVETIPVDVTLRIETFHAQAVFKTDNQEVKDVNYTMNVSRDELTCQSFDVVLLSGELVDYTKPMQISMRYEVAPTEADKEPSIVVNTSTDKRITDYDVTKLRKRRQVQFPGSARRTGDAFCSSCPVPSVDLPNQHLTTLSVPFSVGCGSDAICQTDLKLSHSFTNLSNIGYIIGSTPTLELVLMLKNGGEPASLPHLLISVPSPVSLLRLPPSCKEEASGTHESFSLSCNVLPHPFYNTSEYILPLTFDMLSVTGDIKKLVFNVSATSAGVELVESDNIANITLSLISQADVEIRGTSRDAALVFDNTGGDQTSVEDFDSSPSSFSSKYEFVVHTYQVSKHGPTPVKAVNVSFLVPVAAVDDAGNLVEIAQLYPPQAYLNSQPLTCVLQEGQFIRAGRVIDDGEENGAADSFGGLEAASSLWSPSVIPGDDDSFDKHPKSDGASSSFADDHSQSGFSRRKREVPKGLPPAEYPSGNSSALVLGCGPAALSRCSRVLCQTVPLLDTGDRITVSLELRLDLKALTSLSKSRVLLTSTGRARILDTAGIPASANRLPDSADVATELLAAQLAQKEVPWWIVVVSVLGALLLLALITQGLHMAGFFRRHKKEELEQEQQADHVMEAMDVKDTVGGGITNASFVNDEGRESDGSDVSDVKKNIDESYESDNFGSNMFIVPGTLNAKR